MLFDSVGINPGTHTIYSSTLNDARKSLLKKALDDGNADEQFRGGNLAQGLADYQSAQDDDEGDANKNMAKFLQTMGMMTAGRGVNKASMTPAQLNGFNPQNPSYFGMQAKQAVPYQKIIASRQNMSAVLQNYQEKSNDNGPSAQDAANILSNIRRSETMIGSAFDKSKTTSIYAGVPKSAAQNLYEINIRNQRDKSIYALL